MNATGPQPGTALEEALRTTAPGQIVSLGGLDTNGGRYLNLSSRDTGTALLFSNDPETITKPNRVLARDPALSTGQTRLFLHHENGTGRPQKLAVVVRGGQGGTWLALRRRGVAGPWANALVVGRQAVYRWLADSQFYPALRLAEGQVVSLDPVLSEAVVAPGQVMGAVMDVDVFPGGTAEVAVVACDPEVAPDKAYPSLPPHPRVWGTFVRGTAPACDRELNTDGDGHDKLYDTAWGVAFYRAGDDARDPYLSVQDRLEPTGRVERLPGNYGLLYRFHLWVISSDGRSLAIVVNPRGTEYGGAVKMAPGIDNGGVVYLPWSPDSLADPGQAIVAGRYRPGKGLGVWMQYMLPGGSNAPVDLVLIPYRQTRG